MFRIVVAQRDEHQRHKGVGTRLPALLVPSEIIC
jgi:hypothetical protein